MLPSKKKRRPKKCLFILSKQKNLILLFFRLPNLVSNLFCVHFMTAETGSHFLFKKGEIYEKNKRKEKIFAV